MTLPGWTAGKPFDVQELASHIEALPSWDNALDDDPNWVRDTSALTGFLQLPPDTALLPHWALIITKQTTSIEPSTPLYLGQRLIRLDALVHYLTQPDVLFDPEPWFGVARPVVRPFRDGLLVLDGTHRVVAARLLGRSITSLLAKKKQPHEEFMDNPWLHESAAE